MDDTFIFTAVRCALKQIDIGTYNFNKESNIEAADAQRVEFDLVCPQSNSRIKFALDIKRKNK